MPRYKFSDIAYNVTDKRMPNPEDKDLYIAPNNLDTETLSVPEFGYKVDLKGSKLIMHKGDMLFGRREPQLKKAAIAPHDGLFSAHGMIFHPKEDVITKDFFPFFISSDYFFDAAIRISVGSLSPTVNWSDLKDLEFNIPDISEQQNYAKVLWGIIRSKKAYGDLLKWTDELVKSQFIEMTQGTGSKPVRMGDIATYINGAAFKPRDWGNTGRPIIRIQNLNDPTAEYNYFDGEIEDKYLVRNGEVLISWATHLEAYIWNGGEGWLNQHIFRTVFDKMEVDKTFFIYAANLALKEAFKKAHGFKATMEHIKRGDFEDSIVMIPSIEIQRQFGQFAEQADKSKFAANQALKDLSSLHKSVIQRCFK